MIYVHASRFSLTVLELKKLKELKDHRIESSLTPFFTYPPKERKRERERERKRENLVIRKLFRDH